MEAAAWKKSKTGVNCPSWCVQVHDHENPENGEYLLHESAPMPVSLPTGGDTPGHLGVRITTCSVDDWDIGALPVRLEMVLMADGEAIELNIKTKAGLDQLAADLRQTATALEEWKSRLAT
ncbi:DUF6907 domain-containing protein [Streptomyces syringium]|uniref:DUF6907 domain-containing protein n=1 Tax=Streptomyces syringium TaxID=76729 RepID=UPI0037D71D9F